MWHDVSLSSQHVAHMQVRRESLLVLAWFLFAMMLCQTPAAAPTGSGDSRKRALTILTPAVWRASLLMMEICYIAFLKVQGRTGTQHGEGTQSLRRTGPWQAEGQLLTESQLGLKGTHFQWGEPLSSKLWSRKHASEKPSGTDKRRQPRRKTKVLKGGSKPLWHLMKFPKINTQDFF